MSLQCNVGTHIIHDINIAAATFISFQFSLVFLILRTQSFSNTYLVCSAGVQWPVKVGLWVGISVLVLGTSATITALVTRDKDSTAG